VSRCFRPILARRGVDGAVSLVRKQDRRREAFFLRLRCGKCTGCRLSLARSWAIRCYHESQLHAVNSFVTLTYSDEHLAERSLRHADFQRFAKRLRKVAAFRYFMCGEYGENKSRPHYHSCLFNFDFPDKSRIEDSRSGHPQFESKILTEIWSMGRATIGALTPESAAYTAGYVQKKMRGSLAPDYYGNLTPEYTACSRRPAIGLRWIEKYHSDVYNYDTCMIDGKTQRPPRYYDKYFEKTFPLEMLDIKSKREYNIVTINQNEQSEARLNVKHKIKLKNQETFGKRNLNSDTINSIGISDAQRSYDQKVVKYREEICRQ